MKQNEPILNPDAEEKKRRNRKKVTLREIARIAGCAHCTVSRALADKSCVTDELRNRILKIARDLGYVQPGTKSLALLTPFFPNIICYYNTRLLAALSRVLDREGCSFDLIPENHLRVLNEKHIDGAISLCYSGETAKKWSALNSIPLVCINDFAFHTDRIYSVCSDDRQAMERILDYLRRRGHRKIACCDRVPQHNLNHLRRRKFFLEFAGTHSLFLCTGNTGQITETVLEAGITALICPFEMTDLTLYAALRNAGIRIPQDLELICWQVPGITEELQLNGLRVEQNFDRLAEEAAALLMRLMQGGQPLRDVSVPYRIAERPFFSPHPH